MRRRTELAGLLLGMLVTAGNIPVGATLLGLWTASRVAGDEPITMPAVGTFVLVAGATAIGLTLLLGRLGARYDAMIGRTPHVRRHVPWLRPMSGERVGTGAAQRLGALDVVLIVVVAATLIAFEIWFAFFSGSPFDQRSGRD